MQEFNRKPIVDVLSKQLKREVVMSGDKYVYFDTKEIVVTSEIEIAIKELANDELVWNSTLYQKQRADEYVKQGITIEALTIAIAEKEAGDDAELIRLIGLKTQIKLDIPKPE